MTTKKVAICIDDWKLDIFKKHLDGAKIPFTQKGRIPGNALVLMVEVDHLQLTDLGKVVKAANDEAAKEKAKKGMH